MAHLTESDRLKIEAWLHRRRSLQQIARQLGKSRTTISREVLKHRQASEKGASGRISNRCIHRLNCDVWHLCSGRRCRRRCSACRICNHVCPGFHEEICPKLSQPPYVCNGCPDEFKCVLRKQYYLASSHEYRQLLIESRNGANLTEAERAALSNIIHDGTQNGQSVHHIVVSNPDRFTVYEKTVYRYINAGIIRTKRGRYAEIMQYETAQAKAD
ncbi:helix-turn-helix domain-containing protein [Victivallis sp. Marseille-Q1083]|uniref:helix-turn-helix domain-containing protein n=1 Tax=Victivallis sp. Marseille-Q1083 TaxID=2717288 RepID=UPI00158D11BD|nr:helix-turn-helix domain-containing protein [Victivallis sp. Marseille-Q1083]